MRGRQATGPGLPAVVRQAVEYAVLASKVEVTVWRPAVTTASRPELDSPPAVGQRLQEARVRAGLSQRQLAFPGCTPGYISRLERGHRVASERLLRKLAARLGVSLEYLLTGREPEPPKLDAMTEAEIAFRLDDLEAAERIYEDVLSDPLQEESHVAALTGLGRIAFDRGEPERAVDLLQRAAGAPPGTQVGTEAAETLARGYALLGDVESALAILQRHLDAARERDDLIAKIRFGVLLADVLIDANRHGVAAETLATVVTDLDDARDPVARARLWWSQSRLHSSKGDYEAAARYARKALDVLEQTEDTLYAARAYQLLAHVEIDRGRAEESLTLLDSGYRLVAENGNHLEQGLFQLERARALALLGEKEQAAALAMEASRLLANSSPVDRGRSYALLAELFDDLGEVERALELYELAAETLPFRGRHSLDAHGRLADLLERQGRKDEALAVLKRALGVQQSPRRLVPGGAAEESA
jgi:tetratricopeptide (TPR) repeat protein